MTDECGRNDPPDDNDSEVEEGLCDHDNDICTDIAHGVHSGICRGCGNYAHNLSNDDGWCGDCN